ncbi:hypothetical protein GGX14DRAFT_672022 [Mycena pura]|uniref:Uncharacterized protein n=1 Tax=Mycena pura TaxID=153505 RepID=A0AAD6V129_9AGAR|nr:hypothetical protein GGX14DRAFT_672022 [Mycena pura]
MWTALLVLAPPGIRCSSSNNHLDPASKKFVSDCPETMFCPASSASKNTSTTTACAPRACRRDEFPFGYAAVAALPPLCARDAFCPDDGSGCRLLVPAGAACELDRDEQCAPPPDWGVLASTRNFNGSICLRSVCLYANVTLGEPCITSNTTYIDIGPSGQDVAYTVTRDNCQSPQLYCDAVSPVCKRTLPVNSLCVADQQCTSLNCAMGTCADPPETPLRIAPWQSALIATAIVGVMVAICMLLTLLHKRHRLDASRELHDYCYQQIGLRRSIIALHSVAANRCALTDEKKSG